MQVVVLLAAIALVAGLLTVQASSPGSVLAHGPTGSCATHQRLLLWKDNGYNGGALEICKNANAATLGAFNNWASSAQYDESPAVAGVFGVCVYVGQNFVGEMWKAFTHLDQVQWALSFGNDNAESVRWDNDTNCVDA